MGIWLLAAVLQIQASQQAQPADTPRLRPRFSIGVQGGGAAANSLGEGGAGAIAGAGLQATIPLWGRDSLSLRAMHVIPYYSGGMYEVRWQRHVQWKGPFQPDYAGVGAVGFYWLDTGLRGRLKPSFGGMTYPLMASFTAGWENPRTRRVGIPFELSIYIHPYGLLAASATVGVTWGPTRSDR